MLDTRDPQAEAVEHLYFIAAEQIRNGKSAEEVRSQLMAEGLDGEAAAAVVFDVSQALQAAIRAAAEKDMLHGALWCVGGIIVTAVSYTSAAPGGTFVVTWGAIVYGAIQFFKGLTADVPPPTSSGAVHEREDIAAAAAPPENDRPSWGSETRHAVLAAAKVIAGIGAVVLLVTALAWLLGPRR